MPLNFRDIGDLPTAETLENEDWVPVGINATGTAAKVLLSALSTELPGTIEGLTASAAELNLLDGAGAVVASGTQHAHVADAVTNHALNSTFSDVEVESALNALGVKINLILDALEAFNINAAS